jgi:adenosine deaminase
VLGVYPGYAEHPLPRLAAAGVRITLGSDDPPYFGASIAGEYEVAQAQLGFDEDDLKAITATAIDAAFCDDAVKCELRRRAGTL